MSTSENKYWRGIEELEADAATLEAQSNEFSDKLPMEEILGDTEELSSNRRDFLKFFGFSVSAVALAACNKAPVKYAMPYIDKPETVTPGKPLFYATSCGVYNEGFPIIAKVREGRPIKLDGNEKSLLSQGGLDAISQASILSLYDVNRIAGPRVDGEETDDWSSVDKKVAGLLSSGKKVHVVTRTVNSPVMQASIDKFVGAHNATHVVYDPISYEGIVNANKESFGIAGVPNYNFDKADVIVSFGADFLGTWISPVRFSADYMKNRIPTPENASMSKHFQIESNMSLTGTNADYRYTIPASKQGLYLVSLYNMVASKLGQPTVSGKKQELAGNALNQIADALVNAAGKSLVVCDSNNKEDQLMTNAINNLLGSYGNTIDMTSPMNISNYDSKAFDRFISDVKSGRSGAVVLVNCNPVYSHAKGAELAEALKKTKVITTSMVIDESSEGAAVHSPDNHPLESWDIMEPMKGHYLTAQPTISKVFNTRSAAESLRAWSGEKVEMGEDQASRAWVSDYISSTLGKDASKVLHDGMATTGSGEIAVYTDNANGAAAAIASSYKESNGFELSLYQKVGVRDGQWAVNPWCHELPDPITKVTYDNYITISRTDAEANDWEQGDFLKVTTKGGSIDQLPLLIQPGQARGTIGIALGYGREVKTTLTNDLTDLGKNAYPLVNGSSYVVQGVQLEKVGSGYEFAQTQTHHMIEGRDYMREATLDEYKENHAVRNDEHHYPVADLWSEYDYSKGHHWGMAIDMNACTGCGACVVSCSLENNVPVVGRKEVRRRREMHWIRIDRYYAFEVQKDETASVRVGPSH
ncbi:MAG: TAT-variant-translocated molybdopterin oxidoreductase, partial [Bacteroidia bacterium]|nr:TAT-variant-translocated molybdopterin oxidoreductase [Bacteroidia bacterium]